MDIQKLLQKAEETMEKAYQHTMTVFATFRVDRVDPSMVKEVMIKYYEVPTPLYQVATITVEGATTLRIKPWEKGLLQTIRKSLVEKEQNDFSMIDLEDSIQLQRRPLTEESRKNMAKTLAKEAEQGRVAIRNIRKPLKHSAKESGDEDAIKQFEQKLQELTDRYIKKIDLLYKERAAAIMKV